MDVREKLVGLLVEFVEVDAWDNGEFIEKDIDFQKIADFIMEAPADFFMYRDFQSRNIMVKDYKISEPFFEYGPKCYMYGETLVEMAK